MADIVDVSTRSRMMAGIRSRDTSPERVLRAALHRRGLRFRLHARDLPGTPDIVLPRWHAAIQVHGCFWHRHPGCRYATTPATRPEFWQAKFEANVARDARHAKALLDLGWRVGVVWACTVSRTDLEDTADRVADWLKGSRQFEEFGRSDPGNEIAGPH